MLNIEEVKSVKVIIDVFIQTWYAWILILVIGILTTPKMKGFFGGKSVSFFLSKLEEDKYKVINNIMLKVNGKTVQIDHVVVSNYGIFVIETKNYKGWIIGNEYDDNWKQVIYKRKEKLHNPIKQNYGHIQALKEVLSGYNNLNFISIITFTTNADLKVNTKTEVVYTIKLVKTIKKYTIESISNSEREKIYTRLIALNVDSKVNRKEHVKAIHNNIKDKNEKISNNICPRCGGKLVVRNGKYGEFKGCSNYPKCRFTEN